MALYIYICNYTCRYTHSTQASIQVPTKYTERRVYVFDGVCVCECVNHSGWQWIAERKQSTLSGPCHGASGCTTP